MRYAIVDGERRRPFKSGKGICPICCAPLIAHFGEIELPHWQHARGALCDPWHEPETEWHRKWKNKFPETWQEYAMEDKESGERHLADVRTDRGLVIEFQNSPITTSTIKMREAFYGDIIWVVNANTYKDNFIIASEVTARLKSLEDTLLMSELQIKAAIDDELKEQETKTQKIEQRLKDTVDDAEKLHGRIDRYQEFIKNCEDLTEKIKRWIVGDEGHYSANCNDLYDLLKRSYKNRLFNIINAIRRCIDALNKTQQELHKITSLEHERIGDKAFRKIPHEKIIGDNFGKVYVMARSSKDTFFREYQRINSEMEVFRYKYSADKYDFFIDYDEEIFQLQQSIEELRTEKQNYEQEGEQIEAEMAHRVKSWLIRETASSREQLDKLKQRILILSEECDMEKSNLDYLRDTKLERLDVTRESLRRKYNGYRQQIMKDYKGQYRLIKWKREHKAWREASQPIFFDVGENYLFKKVRNESFRKVSIEEFMKNAFLSILAAQSNKNIDRQWEAN